MRELVAEAKQCHDWIVSIRRELHRHPETMYEEEWTSAFVRRTLAELGIPFTYPAARTGVIAKLGDKNGPCVALRADMDALPIREEADVEFRSEVDGKMHACGHDCHTAMLLGAARLLKSHEAELRGTVKLLFQPAEEGGAGGLRMCEEGALSSPDVERILGLHVWPFMPVGFVASRAGTLLAAAGMIEITVSGRAGHAGMPHTTADPVVTAAKIICELQTVVSSEVDPRDAAVISVTTVQGGEAMNIVPGSVRMTGTIRSLATDGLKHLQSRIREMAGAIASANGCEAKINFPGNDYPATVNDSACWSSVRALAGDLFGVAYVREMPPVMAGEDFSFYAERIPACFVAIGVQNDAIDARYPIHHPGFKVDETALPLAAALHAGFALRSLAELRDMPSGAVKEL